MFSSTPTAPSFGFGQGANSSSSPFGAKTSNQNPFAPGSFGSGGAAPTPFGTSTGSTPFGTSTGSTPFGTSTGSTGATMFAGNSTAGATAFGQPAISSPFESGSIFGQTPGAYATAPSFGNTSTGLALVSGNSSAFCRLADSNPFRSQSVFGQISNSSNNNPFGPRSFGTAATTFGTSTEAGMFSGNSTDIFGASSFAFGSSASSTSAPFSNFGTSSLSSTAFSGSPSSAPLVSQSIFGETNNLGFNNPFSSKPLSTTPFGGSTREIFGGSSMGSLGGTSSALSSKSIATAPLTFSYGRSNTRTGAPIFNKESANLFKPSQPTSPKPVFDSSHKFLDPFSKPSVGSTGNGFSSSAGPSSTSASGASSNFNFAAPKNHETLNSRSIFGRASSQFGSNGVSATWVTKTFPLASQPTSTGMKFGQSAFDGQHRGSRIASYVASKEVVGRGSTEPAAKMISISAMPTFKDKSHEELRFEDSQFLGNKDLNGLSTSAMTASASSSSASGSATTSGTASGFILGLTGNKTLSFPYQFSEPSAGKTNAFIGSSIVTPNSQPQPSSAISTGTGLWGNLFSSNPSLVSVSNSTGFSWTKPELVTTPQTTQTVVATDVTAASISEQSLAEASNAGTCRQSDMQQSESQNIMAVKQSVFASPFGMESRLRVSSVGCPTSGTTVQYGISSIPVSDKPAPVKRNSLLTVRHLSLGRNRPSVEKYQPESNCQKVPFYKEKLPGIYKVGASFIPRENPRSWVLNPMVEGPLETDSGNSSLLEEGSINISETGNSDERNNAKVVSSSSAKCNISTKTMFEATSTRAEEVSAQYEGDADLEAILPKLKCPDYYIKPPIQELAAKERAEPGFCCHVKDFVVGREGYGSIRFFGETDVRNLDLESLIQFNHREVIVNMDMGKKPQVGQSLNKPAEVTLLNIKCLDKNTGKQYMDGPKIDKWRNMLIKKAAEQDAEFVSYNPISGEWKFRVQHF